MLIGVFTLDSDIATYKVWTTLHPQCDIKWNLKPNDL